LYSLYAQPVYRYIYSRIRSVPEAEDVTAQTFLAALEHFPMYRHDGCFASWLFSIARSKTMDYFRRQRDETSFCETAVIAVGPNLLIEDLFLHLRYVQIFPSNYRVALALSTALFQIMIML
jgi:RNA polymerase sigma-70 factor (ECF subfamily)